jgi:hypothetical protein
MMMELVMWEKSEKLNISCGALSHEKRDKLPQPGNVSSFGGGKHKKSRYCIV